LASKSLTGSPISSASDGRFGFLERRANMGTPPPFVRSLPDDDRFGSHFGARTSAQRRFHVLWQEKCEAAFD